MNTSDLESKQAGLERRLTAGELSWLKENGGRGEGIILSVVSIWTDKTTPNPMSKAETSEYGGKSNPDYTEFRVDKKTNILSRRAPASSLFALTDPILKKNWPGFLPLGVEAVALVGLHVNDFSQIVTTSYPVTGQLGVKAKAFFTLDLLETTVPTEYDEGSPLRRLCVWPVSPGRETTVKTTKGELRTLTVAEDWQERLRQARPFRFGSWNEVLDVIEER